MYVVCTLPNASNKINGIEFEDCREGKISKEPVSEDVAFRFATIPGYKVVSSKDGASAKPDTQEVPSPKTRGRR